jgi:hypothetical protein
MLGAEDILAADSNPYLTGIMERIMAAKKWEYRRMNGTDSNWNQYFNDMGREGWELVTILTEESEFSDKPFLWGYFKREIDR